MGGPVIFQGRGGMSNFLGFAVAFALVLLAVFLAWALEFRLSGLGNALMVALPILMGLVALAYSVGQLGRRKIQIEDGAVEFSVRGAVIWRLPWREMIAIESYRDRMGFGRAGFLIVTDDRTFRLDTWGDFGPEKQLQGAFREMARRIAGPSVKVIDRAGWAKEQGPA